MKKLLSTLLALALTASMIPGTLAASTEATDAANNLHSLGLFDGTGTDANGNPIYDLDRTPTRHEAITMLVRLLGAEDEALAATWETPFTDVVEWAQPYVGYAYANGLTTGTSDTTFGGTLEINASQYLTFVLRALGYEEGPDFQWDKAWELTDKIGATDGRYNVGNTAFVRGDMAIISNGALDVSLKNTTTPLIETIPLVETPPPAVTPPPVETTPKPTGAYSIDRTGAIPSETGARKLTDAQLAALAEKEPEEVAPVISTLADAYAWLKQEGYVTTGMMTYEGVIQSSLCGTELSWESMSRVIHTLLEDDYDEVGTLICIAQPDEPEWDMYHISFNYVKTGGYYYITDPIDHLSNTGWYLYRAHTIKTNDLSLVKDALKDINGSISNLLTLATYSLPVGDIGYKCTTDPIGVTLHDPYIDITYLYRANANDLQDYVEEQQSAADNEAKYWANTAPTLNISDYGMPNEIGNTTLTYESALALVGKDPSIIQANVKTVGDVLQYMIAARFGFNSPDAYTPWYGDWGFDAPGDEQLKQNFGCCCGGYANTVSYLLQGDYEKVGTLRWVGGGNHTISWVYTEGNYYVFDFTQYCCGGNYNNYLAPVTVLDSLDTFYDQLPDTYSFFPKSEIVIMVAFESGDAMYPSQWYDPPNFTGLVFPTEAKGKITVIFQKDPQFGIQYKEITSAIPDWNN